jgi:hypothetical protein
MASGLRGRDDLYNVRSGTPLALRVASREELVNALRQQTASVVIADRKLARPFELLLWAREARFWFLGALMAAVLAYTISQRYQVNLKGEWNVGRLSGSGEIILTPTQQVRPSSSAEE